MLANKAVTKRAELIQIIDHVQEVPHREFRDQEYVPHKLFSFDYDLNPVSIVTSDHYDILMHELHRDGHLPFVPGYDYFEAFRDSVVWVE